MNLEAYEKIYDQYFRLARKIANDILDDYYLAGDVCQEVFTEMFQKKDLLDEKDIKFWIVLNTNRRAIDQKRRIYRSYEVEADFCQKGDYDTGSANTPESFVLRKEETEYKKTALDELREHNVSWYEMLLQANESGESCHKLAQCFGIKEINLRVQMHRARKWLKRRFRDLYYD